MLNIPETHKNLLSDEKKAFAQLATLMADGSPQVTPIWFNIEGDCILVNSALGRIKDKNMRARSSIALVITDPENPYRYIQIRGKVIEISMVGAEEHIDILNYKYRGNPIYPSHSATQPRVIYKILPEKVQAMG
ncbi:MAG: PPOX class F420-dependent oxidoreductase [Chloroflexi bacterium]|nr:PPOX class F420-dependent oxidoreductase [Chloroflexota bacterium]